jgi:two-component system, chemotaxis family, protein-glutamate methylesterase/glutaminase
MVRVLIADDSLLTRVVLKDLLARDAEIEVIAEVCNGRDAVTETCRLRPDLVIMDVMMPIMDGIAAVTEIMSTCPTPILVLSGNVDVADSRCAFTALRHGALDVMAKPQGLVTEAFNVVAELLIEKVKFLARIRVMHHFRRQRQPSPALPVSISPSGQKRTLLAIGASTGGPKAVLRLVKELPAQTGAAILIVQHIASGFAAGFAEWLDRECACRVRLACHGDSLEAGVALVAPTGLHMLVRGERIVLEESPPVNCCRPSVDSLFFSIAAERLAGRTVGVLLTGMGRDGAEGLAALKEQGASTIAQDEASCAVFGMPKAAIQLQAAQRVLSLADIPGALQQLLR